MLHRLRPHTATGAASNAALDPISNSPVALLPAASLPLPDGKTFGQIARLKLAALCVFAVNESGPVELAATLNVGAALAAIRRTVPKGAPWPMLAGCLWCASIKDAHRILEVASASDLRTAARIGSSLTVSVADATRALKAAAQRLDVIVTEHETLLRRVRASRPEKTAAPGGSGRGGALQVW